MDGLFGTLEKEQSNNSGEFITKITSEEYDYFRQHHFGFEDEQIHYVVARFCLNDKPVYVNFVSGKTFTDDCDSVRVTARFH